MKLDLKQFKVPEADIALNETQKAWIKFNYIELAKDHKKKCKNSRCSIQLMSLWLGLERMHIKLTKKEKNIFW
jgi:uncharacterized protein YecT (DUF1311 family)